MRRTNKGFRPRGRLLADRAGCPRSLAFGDRGSREPASPIPAVSPGGSIRPGFSLACDAIDPEALLPAVRVNPSKPDAVIFGRGLKTGILKTAHQAQATILLGAYAAQQSACEPMHSTKQSLLNRPPITLVCMKHVTSARLFAAKVVPTFVELLCAVRGASETITE